MTAHLRGPMGEVNKLIVALKLHFLDLLTPEQRRQQLEMLMEVCDRELVRLNDLRAHHTDSDGALIALARSRDRRGAGAAATGS